MRLDGLKNRIGGVALMFALAVGVALTASATAQAQWPNYRYDDNTVRWDRDRTRQYAFLLGYHNAYTEGKEAAERSRRIDYNDMPSYRSGLNGWLSWMGHQDTYRDNYRRGYEAGFKDGQERRGRRYSKEDVERVLGAELKDVYDNSYGYYDDDYDRNRDRRYDRNDDYYRNSRYNRNEVMRIAQQNGYNDGVRNGQSDRSRRRSYNYNDSSEYRNATRGYRSEYGDRNLYRQVYQEAYRQGYEDGYRGRRSTSSGGWRWPF